MYNMYMFDIIHQIFFFLFFRAFNLLFKDNPFAKKKKTLSHSNLFLKKWPISKEEKWFQDLY